MKSFYLSLLLTFFAFHLNANDIHVSNVTLTNQDPNNNTTMVQFDLSWENSWRISQGPANWDAAWIFIKFRDNGSNWGHARLNRVDGTAANDGHTQPAGATITTPTDRYGCFIHRDADGSGSVNWTGIQLKWNYGGDGVQDYAMIDIEVFAIEMVYIPQGSFSLGRGNNNLSTEVDKFRKSFNTYWGSYQVTSENAINVGDINQGTSTYGYLYYFNTPPNTGDQLGPIPASFPKGYNAFYAMKYEVSEEQYVAFFNSLWPSQKATYDITRANRKNLNGTKNRNTITVTNGFAQTTAPNRAVSYCGWTEIAAYLDWAALRPFTELEYEKMARGPYPPNQNNHFAWGTNNIHVSPYAISSDGTENSMITNPGVGTGNAHYFSTSISGDSGPFRVGIFAASALTKNREETGASYYGVMELSGNMFERCVSVGNANNRQFTGGHGDGSVFSLPTNWVNLGTNGPMAYRGGSCSTPSDECRISDRKRSCRVDISSYSTGIRGVRTAN